MSTITEQDIKNLTPEHRIVWHLPPGQPVEMGLFVDRHEALCADGGQVVRYKNGATAPLARSRIVRIIPPAFAPRVGMVIGHPGLVGHRLIHTGDGTVAPWLGYAPELNHEQHWFTAGDARILVEDHGWEVVDDLAAPGEVSDAEVEAAARARAGYVGAGGDGWSVWANEARAVLEAAREARND